MILLIGNKLSNRGLNPTSIEKLEENLSSNYSIRSASDKQSSFIRIIEMLSLVFLYRKICKLIIVDVFGTKAFYFSCLVILLARVYKLPVLPVFRGGSLPERFNKCPTLFELIFQKNQLVICPSSYLSIFFENKGISTHIIPNYINIEKYPFQNRKDIAPNLFWVRSLHSIYNPEMAIKVLFELCKKYPHARLCLVGPHKDDSINKIDELIKNLKLNNQVIIPGKLEKKEWINLSKEYDLFLNTTNFDNHPVSLIEAMALGLPIVSTNAGGIPNMLVHNKTAKLVETNDVFSMVSQINEYLSNSKQRIKISINARKNVESNFDKSKVLQQWIKVLNENMKVDN